MATENLEALLRVPGRLSIGPTNIAVGQSYPWGGTALGLVKDVAVHPTQATELLHGEEYGPSEVIDGLDLGQGWAITGALRSTDPDAFSTLMSSTAAGPVSGRKQVVYPGTGGYKAGGLLTSRAVKLLFTPNDLDHQLMVIFYSALPAIEAAALIDLRYDQEGSVPFGFYASRDGSGRIAVWGRREDIPL